MPLMTFQATQPTHTSYTFHTYHTTGGSHAAHDVPDRSSGWHVLYGMPRGVSFLSRIRGVGRYGIHQLHQMYGMPRCVSFLSRLRSVGRYGIHQLHQMYVWCGMSQQLGESKMFWEIWISSRCMVCMNHVRCVAFLLVLYMIFMRYSYLYIIFMIYIYIYAYIAYAN